MKLKRHQASREGRLGVQIAECLEIGCLAICRETTDCRLHLLYQQDIPSLLHEAGYEVRTEELNIPGLDENFNELQYAVYKGWDCEVYFFDGLAVKADEERMEYHAQEGLELDDLARMWADAGIDWQDPDSECHVPMDPSGKIAVQIEQLQYDVWDALYRAPGEDMETEERLEGVQWLCDAAKDSSAINQMLDDLKQSLTEELDELSGDQETMEPERQNYTIGRIDDIICLLEKVECVRQEYSALAESAIADQTVTTTELTM